VPRLHPAHHRPLAVCCIALSAIGFLGCSPAPEPEPTPTPAFASEEEAFAAAEETYRAYIDALNAERSGTPPAKPSQDYLSGQVLEAELANENELREAGVHIEGSTAVSGFYGLRVDIDSQAATVVGRACLDITDARAVDTTGTDVTVVGRSDIYAIDVTFAGAQSSLLITAYEIATDFEC
jgi:hypothetical protein